jgi:hypothetical protein
LWRKIKEFFEMFTHRFALAVPVAFLLSACPAPPDTPEESDTADTDDDDGQVGETEPIVDPTNTTMTGPVPPGSETATDPETDTAESESSACNFICLPDGTIGDCNVWEQDCAVGQKCMPYANDGGNSWNSLTCVPIDADPGSPGDACTVEGSGVSGFDTCGTASMCWNVDPETGEGVCTAFCQGTEDNPVCDDPNTSCVIANDGVLILCLPDCDPLLQNCPDAEACYVGDNAFVCVPDASGPDMGAFGDPCEFTNACDPGLLCVGAAAVPGCVSAQCCSEFCDLAEADPDASCQGQGDGQQCVGLFDDGEAPPGTEDFGFCAIPS